MTARVTTERTVALAFVPPALFGIGAFLAVAGVMGVEGLATALREAGWLGPVSLLVAFLAIGVVSVAMGLGLPRPLALIAATAPCIIAALGALWSLSRVLDVLDIVSPPDRATLFCAGYAESLAGRVIVAPVAASLFFGVCVSALLRARAERAERWSMLALAALAVVGAGFAIASATAASALHEGLRTIAVQAPSQRALMVEVLHADVALGRTAGLVIAAVGGIALLVVVTLASARHAPVGETIGGAGIAVCALALLPAPALDIAHEAMAWSGGRARTAERPWRGVADFTPLEIADGAVVMRAADSLQGGSSRGDVVIVTQNAVVLGHDRVMTVSSTNITSQDVRGFIASTARGAPQGAPFALRVAFDARAPAPLVATVLGVARDAGVEVVNITGVAHLGALPGIAGRAADTVEVPVLLGCELGVGCVDARNASAAELLRRMPSVRAQVIALALDAHDAVHARPLE